MTTNRDPHWKIIMAAVAKECGVTVSDIVSARRTADIVKPRHLSMYMMRYLTPYSLPTIGRVHGGRDHGTVVHGITNVLERIVREPELGAWVEKIIEQLRKELSGKADPVVVDAVIVKAIRKRLRDLATLPDERLMEVML